MSQERSSPCLPLAFHAARRLAAALLFGRLLGVASPQDALAEPAAPADPVVEARLTQAREHFERGVSHFDRSEWQAALVEFLESRALAPNKANTKNAAICLRKVGRFDEALEMFRALLRDFTSLPEADAELARREIAELSASIGSLELRGAPAGARVSIDGIDRGSTPLSGPLRLSAGTHTLRVVKEGSLPFEMRFDLAGRQAEVVHVKLPLVTQAGRLRVTERYGRNVEVLVDGLRVGSAPWEGALSPGAHGVLLRGEGRLGTSPKRVTVAVGREAVMDLVAVPLSSELVLRAQPADAELSVDGARVGRGSWRGGLEPGQHLVNVTRDGYGSFNQTLLLAEDERDVLTIELEPSNRKPSLLFGLETAVPLGLSWGGDLLAGCSSPCSSSLPFGVSAQGRINYRLASGLGLGVHAGYLRLATTLHRRSEVLDPTGPVQHRGSAEDQLRLAGLVAGADADYVWGKDWPLTLRLSAGTLLGALTDTRSGRFVDSAGASYEVSATQHPRATYFYLGPELRVGYRAFKHFEVSAGAKLLILASLTRPAWDEQVLVYAGETDRGGVFSADDLSGPIMVALLPGLGVSYAF